jgi:hypothetical protein
VFFFFWIELTQVVDDKTSHDGADCSVGTADACDEIEDFDYVALEDVVVIFVSVLGEESLV